MLADFAFESWVVAPAARYDELRTSAVETRFTALLDLGRHAEVIADLWDAAAAAPLRERLWALLMVALYRSGRQSEALSAYQQVRHHLAEELGIDPGPELQLLEQQVLDHASSLSVADARTPITGAGSRRTSRRRSLPIGRATSSGAPPSWPHSEASSSASESATRGRWRSPDRPVLGRHAWSTRHMRRANIRTSRWCGDAVSTVPRRRRCGRGSKLPRRLVRPAMHWSKRSTPTPPDPESSIRRRAAVRTRRP